MEKSVKLLGLIVGLIMVLSCIIPCIASEEGPGLTVLNRSDEELNMINLAIESTITEPTLVSKSCGRL
jgi:hypothetical protein